ncbi:MAG TPA: DUF92 domain-containing protein [Bacteroidota bacterium]|nr:DUF92 domain-containing protein [Bacteroidota bacterium]
MLELQYLAAPSTEEWWRLAGIFVGLLLFIAVGEGVRILFRWPAEFTRKLVHISVAVLIFFAPTIFTVPLPAIILALVFTLINWTAIRLGLFRAIHGTVRQTYGTVYYPLAFLILVLIFWYRAPEIISLSMLVLGFGDAAAAIVGQTHRSPTSYQLTGDVKTLEGSWTMFAVTTLTLMAGIVHFRTVFDAPFLFVFSVAAAAAMMATAWEAISSRGLDNLAVPLATAFVLAYYFLPSPLKDVQQYTTGVGLALGIAGLSFYGGLLTASGSVATFILASIIFGIGGWKWTVPVLAFFVLSSLLSRVGRERKREFDSVFEKTGRRDHAQVAANGGVAGIIVLLAYLHGSEEFYPLYLASIAAVTADTWGTEIGLLSSGRPIELPSFKPVAPGTNGGVTSIGIVGAMLGALVIAAVSLLWESNWKLLGLVALSGFMGSIVDTLLGGTLQARYRCVVCGTIVERKEHHDQPTEFIGGLRWVTNDVVNWACALSGASIMRWIQ